MTEGGGGSGTVEMLGSVPGDGVVCANATPAATEVNRARTSVGSLRFCKILPLPRARGSEKLIHAEYGVEV